MLLGEYPQVLSKVIAGKLQGYLRWDVLVDAIVVKIREEGRVRQCALLIACGIDEVGYRHVLGFALGDKESEASWSELFASLKSRGLTGVEFVISDDHSGLVKAVGSHFAGATWQRCQAHFLRNLCDACPKTEVEAFLAAIDGNDDVQNVFVALAG